MHGFVAAGIRLEVASPIAVANVACHCFSAVGDGLSHVCPRAVRGAIFRFAWQGRMEAAPERVGVLMLSTCGALPMFSSSARWAPRPVVQVFPVIATTRFALDIKEVNSLGRSHAEAMADDPLAAHYAYQDATLAHQQTTALCVLWRSPFVGALANGRRPRCTSWIRRSHAPKTMHLHMPDESPKSLPSSPALQPNWKRWV